MAVINVHNVDEVVNLLKHTGITKTSIYRAISLGKLKAIKVGKRYLVSELALNHFLEGKFDIWTDAG